MNQTQIFLAEEGNRYFQRNSAVYVNADPAHVPQSMQFYGSYLKPGDKVLEIGCCNGVNLSRLASMVPCQCLGIDPSAEAIEDGRQRFPTISLSVGTADDLKFGSGMFDFVLFGFCLYLVDRTLLAKSIAEADRVLKSQGFLGITDFDVVVPSVQPYRHIPGLFTYKMDYSRLFTAYPHYALAGKIGFSHFGNDFHEDPNERLSSVILHKDVVNAYFHYPLGE
jgi:SAM-dependent methyltransferase